MGDLHDLKLEIDRLHMMLEETWRLSRLRYCTWLPFYWDAAESRFISTDERDNAPN